MVDAPAASAKPATSQDETRPSDPRTKRRLLPRFGLRALFVFAILFCLFFAWIGRNLYRIRQEEAAIETLKQAGAMVTVKTERGNQHHPATPYQDHFAALRNELPSYPARALGIADPYPVNHVDLFGYSDDPPQEEALAALAAFPELEGLGLHGEAFDDEALKPIAKLPKLKGLLISETSITGEGLATLSKLPSLTHLTLYKAAPGSDIVSGAASVPQLRSIQLAVVSVSRDDLTGLASLPNLEELDLLQVTLEGDDPFEPLALAPELRTLRLRIAAASRAMTQDDMLAIAELPSVEFLSLGAYDAKLVPALRSMDSLRYLRLYDSADGESAAIEFSAARPEVLVQYSEWTEPKFFLGGEEVDEATAERLADEWRKP